MQNLYKIVLVSTLLCQATPADLRSTKQATHSDLQSASNNHPGTAVATSLDAGAQDCGLTVEELPAKHPDLICCVKLWVNPQRLRRLRRQENAYSVELDNGEVMASLNRANVRTLVGGLGLRNPETLGEA